MIRFRGPEFNLPALGNVIGPLVIWMMKKDQFPLVDDQGKEAVNLQISMTIVAMIKANSGERYRYPLTIRLVK